MIRINDPYQQGQQAFSTGRNELDNPYKMDAREYAQWKRGYREAAEKSGLVQNTFDTLVETFRSKIGPTPINHSQPLCPLCGAGAIEGYIYRHAQDLRHDCDCMIERHSDYTVGLERIWNTPRYSKAFLDSLPKSHKEATFDNLPTHAGNRKAKEVASKLRPGSVLYLWGLPGRGKSHLAVAAARLFLPHGLRVAYWNETNLYAAIRASFGKPERRPDLTQYDVLVWDDMGKAQAHEWGYEITYHALEHYTSEDKTIIITSDLHDEEMDPFFRRVLTDTIRRVQPDAFCIGGDGLDLPEFGKYSVDPRDWGPMRRINYMHGFLKDLREV
jgi:DNA replication protein DnaC